MHILLWNRVSYTDENIVTVDASMYTEHCVACSNQTLRLAL